MRGRAPHRALALGALAWLVAGGAASGATRGAVLHEPIPPDPREDLALHVSLDGDLPAAVQTPSGIVGAPDPRAMPSPGDAAYGVRSDAAVFQPDRDTRRPTVASYDDPFTPTTAPYKRLEAFDAVREDYQLYVRDPRLSQVPTGAATAPGEELFYADLVVDVSPGASVRIPSVGPGARIVRARLGVGATDIPMRVMRDGAEDWFLQATGARAPLRARLVMELSIPRAAFGGDVGNPAWGDLPAVSPLPDGVGRDAAQVRAAIGVSRAMRPRDALFRLVQYFRGFTDSDEPPAPRGSVYLDLALSKRGVCRHRAFAFLVTAQSLGLPTRMIQNEAHAWVEVHDGMLWHRIDLGGAGRLGAPAASGATPRPPYRPPPDVFAWPPQSRRGDDMVSEARASGQGAGGAGSTGSASASPGDAPGAASAAASAGATGPAPQGGEGEGRDDRPVSSLTLAVDEADPHRGAPLRVHGAAAADGEPCAHVAVEIWLRDSRSHALTRLGTLATGSDGAYSGGIVVPAAVPLGDYDVSAHTPGGDRCGAGRSN